MPFKSEKFGVIASEEVIKIKKIESNDNTSEFDFIITDKLSNIYNGNYTYAFDINPLREKEYIEFYNWKLIGISIRGNWYGDWGYSNLLDFEGRKYDRCTDGKQTNYENEREAKIERTIIGARDFAKNNLTHGYYELIAQKDLSKIEVLRKTYFNLYEVSHNILSKKEIIKRTKARIEQYNKYMNCLKDESKRTLYMKSRLSSAMVDYLIQYSQFLEKEGNEEIRQIINSL